MSFLDLEHVSKQFRGIPAVEEVSLRIPKGERLALLGPSGCGKSTTLQLMAGILAPDRGDIVLAGRSLLRIPPERRGMVLVLQRGLLFPHLTVGENVGFGLKMRGESLAVRRDKVAAILERVHLGGMEDRLPGQLSGGQAQRVALARALVIEPQVLLLDEPLSALDANLREEMQALILELQAQTQVTTVIVTHDQAEAVALSDRIALMFQGRIHQVGSPADFYRTPGSEAAARFFGGVNFWPAQADHHRLELSEGTVLTSAAVAYGSVLVTIRPEQIRLSPDPPSGVNVVPVTVQSCRFTGTQTRIEALSAPSLYQSGMSGQSGSGEQGLRLQIWISPSQLVQPGQRLWAYLPPEQLCSLPTGIPVPWPVSA